MRLIFLVFGDVLQWILNKGKDQIVPRVRLNHNMPNLNNEENELVSRYNCMQQKDKLNKPRQNTMPKTKYQNHKNKIYLKKN